MKFEMEWYRHVLCCKLISRAQIESLVDCSCFRIIIFLMAFYFDQISDGKNTFSVEEKLKFDFAETLIWDKTRFSINNYLDLKDFSVFYKIKEIRDLKETLGREYNCYEIEKNRIKSWLSTFSNVSDEYGDVFSRIPNRLAHNFLGARANLMIQLMEYLQNKPNYNLFETYYRCNLASFDVLRKMNYEIKTTRGMENVNLEFAENFRFKSTPGSFNLFNMKKEFRDCIVPQSENEFVYSIDFRQFEFRTFLMLTDADVDFSESNLYEHIANILNLHVEDVKLNIISYMYSDFSDSNLSKIINKNKILENIHDECFMWNNIPVYVGQVTRNKQIHTIIQTISYFWYLAKLHQVLLLLDNRKSKFIFPLHDAMIFSVHGDDLDLLEKIASTLQTDGYKIKQYIGHNFLEQKEYEG